MAYYSNVFCCSFGFAIFMQIMDRFGQVWAGVAGLFLQQIWTGFLGLLCRFLALYAWVIFFKLSLSLFPLSMKINKYLFTYWNSEGFATLGRWWYRAWSYLIACHFWIVVVMLGTCFAVIYCHVFLCCWWATLLA